MLVRVWTTRLVKEKVKEYERFAQEFSVPMFKKQSGILGVTVLIRNCNSLVLTYWNSEEDIVQMENNLSYQETVERIKSRGLLASPQRMNIFDAPVHYMNGLTFSAHSLAAGASRPDRKQYIMDKYLEEFSDLITFDLPDDFKL